MRALLVSGPDDLRETLRGSTVSKLVTTAARFRPADPTTATGATRFALRELARRVQSLEAGEHATPERLCDDEVEWNNIWCSLLTQARNAHSLVIPTVAEDLLSEF